MTDRLPSWDTHDIESLKEFAKIRLVVADLDGTLLRSGTQDVSETIRKFRETLNRYYKYQVTLTLATGRSLTGVTKLVHQLCLARGTPLILYNGSLIITSGVGGVISLSTITGQNLQHILEACSDYSVRILAYVFDNRTFDCDELPVNRELVIGWGGQSNPTVEFNEMKIQWQAQRLAPPNYQYVAVVIDTSTDPASSHLIEARLQTLHEISVTRSGPSFIEIRPHGSNKGTALELVANHLGLQRERILAIGDNDNDSEMLEWAGIGIAIAGASPAAMDNSTYVSRNGAAKGVIEILRLVKNAKRFYFTKSTRRG